MGSDLSRGSYIAVCELRPSLFPSCYPPAFLQSLTPVSSPRNFSVPISTPTLFPPQSLLPSSLPPSLATFLPLYLSPTPLSTSPLSPSSLAPSPLPPAPPTWPYGAPLPLLVNSGVGPAATYWSPTNRPTNTQTNIHCHYDPLLTGH